MVVYVWSLPCNLCRCWNCDAFHPPLRLFSSVSHHVITSCFLNVLFTEYTHGFYHEYINHNNPFSLPSFTPPPLPQCLHLQVNVFVLLSVVCVLLNLAGFILCCQGAQLVSSMTSCRLVRLLYLFVSTCFWSHHLEILYKLYPLQSLYLLQFVLWKAMWIITYWEHCAF